MNSIELRESSDPDRVAALALTVEDIAFQLAQIAAQADDDEVAHGMEDNLRDTVLRAIAAGHPDAAQLAAAALRSDDIGFARYYA
ncbi:MAG: hypothetical protein JWO67_5781 [Streptosporangiaceae bacterium]|nr:hypothetical protein [Streptosporangiaceae bacterium]